MLDLKTVLPNFIKTTMFVAATTISFSVLAEGETDAVEAAVEEATEITDAAGQAMTETTEYGAEDIVDYKDMTETAEELEQEADIIESE